MAKWKPGGPGRPPAHARKRAGRPRKNAAARALGRRGGAARTAKQNAARKRNAVKAGRPGKVCIFCGKPAKGGHKTMRLDASCGMHGWRYRQHTDNEPLITRQAIEDEIQALQRLLVTLAAVAAAEATPETPEPFDPFAPGPETNITDLREPPAEEPPAEERKEETVPF